MISGRRMLRDKKNMADMKMHRDRVLEKDRGRACCIFVQLYALPHAYKNSRRIYNKKGIQLMQTIKSVNFCVCTYKRNLNDKRHDQNHAVRIHPEA